MSTIATDRQTDRHLFCVAVNVRRDVNSVLLSYVDCCVVVQFVSDTDSVVVVLLSLSYGTSYGTSSRRSSS